MKKVMSIVTLVVMAMCLTVSASAASIDGGTHGSSASATTPDRPYEAVEIAAPNGYVEEGETALGTPLVAWTWDYLDEVALEKGYIIVETDDGVSRTYIRDESGYMTTIVIESEFATVCVHCGDMPGAIMGVWCYADEDMVYSTVDLVDLLF